MMAFIEANYLWMGLAAFLLFVCAGVNMVTSAMGGVKNFGITFAIHILCMIVYLPCSIGFVIGLVIAIMRYVQHT